MKLLTKKGIITLLLTFIMAVPLLLSTGAVAYAESGSESYTSLTAEVDGKMSSKKYQTETGGYLTGKVLVKDGMVTDKFATLTSKDKQLCLTDMVTIVDAKITKDKAKASGSANTVSEDTKNDWLTQLQTCDGVGSKLMTTILADTKPDYVTANRIWKPFSGPVGTIMGLGAIVIMAFLGLTMVADICYMTIPMFRGFLEGEGGDNAASKNKSKIISFEAMNAVAQAENAGGGTGSQTGGTGKLALGIYLKRRIVMLIVLGVCLLYLVQGQIFTLVGWILDLLSGFLKF